MMVARMQPPVGYRLSARELLGAMVPRPDAVGTFVREVADAVGARHGFALSSGKAALTVLLEVLAQGTGRRKVVLPAYTCFSVPSAIVKAGLEPVPCDIAPGTFDYDYVQLEPLLDEGTLAVLSIPLFSIPAATDRVVSLCRSKGIAVIEDAAQAMHVSAAPVPFAADARIYSLGRGKNITSGSGGLIVTDSDGLAAAIERRMASLPAGDVTDGAKSLAGLAAVSILVSPQLYWLPAGLPFLKLGTTVFHDDFPIRGFSPVQARLLRGWRSRLERLNEGRERISTYYRERLEVAPAAPAGIACLRYPVVLSAIERRRLLNDPRSRRRGIMPMYPSSVGRIPQLQTRLGRTEFPEADRVAAGLVTLPTHELLTPGDLSTICAVVNGAADPGRPVP
jgi:dTDP-4-amino-4,6-dideoxygalactose transaminase